MKKPPRPNLIAPSDVRAERIRRARHDFYSFRRLINPGDVWGWWQREIAEELQRFAGDMRAGLRPKLVIQAPPQHGKSVQIIDFIAWLAGQNPDWRTIYTSFSDRLGIRANLRLQRMFDSQTYREIFPATLINQSNAVTVSGQYLRNREIIEYVGRTGFFRNTTVRGSITGESLDVGVIDDPIRGRADAQSQAIRDAAWNWFTDDFFTRFSEHAGLLSILTRWHIDDPIGRLIDRDPSVRVLSYSAIADEDEKNRKRGEALFPELKSLAFLRERELVMSAGNWAALYQQKPTLAEGSEFKPGMLTVIPAIPTGTRFVRAWDLASTSDDGDWTAGAKLGMQPNGRLLIAGVERERLGPDGVRHLLLATATRDGYDTTVALPQDPGQAGKAQARDLTRLLSGYSVTSKPVSGDKVTRAGPLASQVNVGNVDVLQGPWLAPLTDELRSFPHGLHDDQVDALSLAYDELTGGDFGLLDFYKSSAEELEQRRAVEADQSLAQMAAAWGR